MAYQDQLLTCEECGKKFVYRVEEQRMRDEQDFDLEPPERCSECREDQVLGPGLHAGVVKWYRDDKHFGFITQTTGSDVFFHRSGIVEGQVSEMKEGTPVWYEVTDTDRGPQAINVHLRE